MSNEASKAMNEALSGLKEMTEAMNLLAYERQKQERMATLLSLVHKMQSQGRSKRAIETAVLGMCEVMKPLPKRRRRDNGASESSSEYDPKGETLGNLLSEVQAQDIQWLWDQRIPRGKLTLLEGAAGIGTSLFAINLAAAVSSGQSMTGGPSGEHGPVVVIAPDESAANILKPRLEAAGGDPSQVLHLKTLEDVDVNRVVPYNRPFSLTDDLELLETLIDSSKAALVIIDPLAAVLGRSANRGLQQTFTLLADLAERTNCAILLIRHLKQSTPGHLPSQPPASPGSTGYSGRITATRSELLLIQDPDEQNRRLLVSTRYPLTTKPPILTFQIVANEHNVPSLRYLQENQPISDFLLGSTNLSSQRQAILQVLQQSSHPLSPTEVAEQTGLAYDAVRLFLSRMQETRSIVRPSRGLYTTLNHPSLLNRPERSADTPNTPNTIDTSDTSDTPAPGDTLDASLLQHTIDTSDTSDLPAPNNTLDASVLQPQVYSPPITSDLPAPNDTFDASETTHHDTFDASETSETTHLTNPPDTTDTIPTFDTTTASCATQSPDPTNRSGPPDPGSSSDTSHTSDTNLPRHLAALVLAIAGT